MSDLDEDGVLGYIRRRKGEKVSGRTINMEPGDPRRAIRQRWSLLWPKVRKLEKRRNVGRALGPEERHRLLDGIEESSDAPYIDSCTVVVGDGHETGEALSLTWGQADLIGMTITVGRAKTSNGTGRMIPFNDELAGILAIHRAWFTGHFGEPEPDHHLFPWANRSRAIRLVTRPKLRGDGMNCGKIRASVAGCMTFGTPSRRGWPKTALPNLECWR